MMPFLKKKKEVGVPAVITARSQDCGRFFVGLNLCGVFTFDTTLRDGTQGEAVSLSAEDKMLIAHKLDELGIDYIEGGWPGSNPKDKEFFARANRSTLSHARLAAFGATRMAATSRGRDPSVNALIGPVRRWCAFSARAGNCRSAGRSASPKKRISQLISDTVRYLKAHGKEVIYDAEHFFDGYKPTVNLLCGRSKPRIKPAPIC